MLGEKTDFFPLKAKLKMAKLQTPLGAGLALRSPRGLSSTVATGDF